MPARDNLNHALGHAKQHTHNHTHLLSIRHHREQERSGNEKRGNTSHFAAEQGANREDRHRGVCASSARILSFTVQIWRNSLGSKRADSNFGFLENSRSGDHVTLESRDEAIRLREENRRLVNSGPMFP